MCFKSLYENNYRLILLTVAELASTQSIPTNLYTRNFYSRQALVIFRFHYSLTAWKRNIHISTHYLKNINLCLILANFHSKITVHFNILFHFDSSYYYFFIVRL